MQIVIDLSIGIKGAGRIYFCIRDSQPPVCHAQNQLPFVWNKLIIAYPEEKSTLFRRIFGSKIEFMQSGGISVGV